MILLGSTVIVGFPGADDALILATADVHDGIAAALCADGGWPKVKGLRYSVEMLEGRASKP